MQNFVANYASAAHLALVTVAPLFLFPFCEADSIATVVLWLSLFAAVWIVMSPSPRQREMPHDARARFAASVVKDPVFWYALVLVAFAGVRALNGGIAMAYDAELFVWSVAPPSVPILPGCVDGAGHLPFAVCVAIGVVFAGIRNSLGPASRAAFLVSATLLAGLAVAVVALSSACGLADLTGLARCSYVSPSFAGTAWGLFLLMGVAATFECAAASWHKCQLLVAVGMSGSAAGLVLFAPPTTIVVFAGAFVLLAIASFPLYRKVVSGAKSLSCAFTIALAAGVGAGLLFFADVCPEVAARRDALTGAAFFPEGFWETRRALSDIALKVWKTGPWLGTGLGSFPIDVRHAASPEDWKVISPFQSMATSGWWQLLSERGVVGVSMWVLGAGFLVWSYFSRMVLSWRSCRFSAVHLLAPLAAAALVAVTFFDCSLTRAGVLLPACAALSISAAAFPVRRVVKSRDMED